MVEQEVLEMLTAMVEEKDLYTAGHSKRVAMYSVRIAEALGLSEEEQKTIYQAGLLHDIGKILTPESVLLKPRKFNRSEYTIIKNHSADGERMVLFISSFTQYAKIIRHHHERYDGDGYPDGLKGEAIPLLSRIMSIADAFDAMTTNRIYKTRKPFDKVVAEIKKHAGSQFDPAIVRQSLDVLASFQNQIAASQGPENTLHEERFAYFFKDVLTNAYSGEYLNLFLQKNKASHRFGCCYFVQLHHMSAYNERYGWKCGDELLREMVLRIKVLFHSTFVFRVFGDDFVVLNSLHVAIDIQEVLYKLCVGFDTMTTTLQHFDIKEHTIDTWEQLENYLLHHE